MSFCILSFLNGQGDSIVWYKDIDSVSIFYDQVQSTINNDHASSIADLLDKSSGVVIRSGGPATLSTVLKRGMGSRHTGLLWSGFNIQSVTNGTFDVSLIRSTHDQVHLMKNSVSAMVGNASVAGAISIESSLSSNYTTELELQYGSDQNLEVKATSKLKSGKYRHSASVQWANHNNVYSYKFADQKFKQRHAAQSIYDFNYKNLVELSPRLFISSKIWLLKSKRQIPVSKTVFATPQDQTDKNFRFAQDFHLVLNDASYLKLRTAYFNDFLGYYTNSLTSESQVNVVNAALDYQLSNNFNLSIQYRKDDVDASFYPIKKSRSTLAGFVHYYQTINDWNWSVSTRPQYVDKDLIPFSYNALIGYQKNKHSLSVQYTKGIMLPTFNDLFWPNGGNEELLNEDSRNLEFTYSYKPDDGFLVELTPYLNQIDNWIQWIPKSGIWQAYNQRKVRNAGFDFTSTYQLNSILGGMIHGKIYYGFVDSRIAKHYVDDTFVGKKTIFVPSHKASMTIIWQKDDWKLSVAPYYYSDRYDTADNSSSIDGYIVMDVSVSKRLLNTSDYEFNCLLAIENTLNNDYEHIRYFAMPLRQYRLTLNFKHK